MPVTLYRSDDASAPQLTSAAGSLIALLDAILVNGYGAKAAAGWSKTYSGTNKAAYRAPTGNRHYLRVDDAATQYTRLRAYETMTDVDTGTGLFPTDAQISGGLYCFKSGTTDATARPWIALATDRSVYLYILISDTSFTTDPGSHEVIAFGDAISYLAGDAYATVIIGRHLQSTSTSYENLGRVSTSGAVTGHFIARSYTQTGGSATFSALPTYPGSSSYAGGSGGVAYPDPVTGGMLHAPMYVYEGAVIRGHLPGLINPLHAKPGAHMDTLSSGSEALLLLNTCATSGRIAFVTSDTWYP